MERIKQALERARQARSEALSHRAEPAATRAAPARSQTEIETDAPEAIEYSTTARVDIEFDKLASRRVVAPLKQDPRAQVFRMLRTQVLRKMREHNWSSLAVTAPNPGNGKSMIAVNLAISMAMEVNQTVLLVDLDLRRPSLHKYLGFDPEYGIQDYFEHDVPISKILVNPSIERLVVLPGRGSIGNSSEVLSSPKMISLVEELKSRYPNRKVVVDLPPVLAIDDALAFLPNVESVLLVVESGANTEEEVKRSLRLLQGTHLVGTVLNKARTRELPGYYY
jgi:protein-tyrosine kinase